MTDATGHFAVLRRSFASISDDQRIQAVIIAFSFGALIEALAGFGAPVAITAAMLMARRLQADQGRRGGARRQHRAGRLRRDRDADHHALRGHRAAEGRPRRDGRPPDAVPGADRAADPGRRWSTAGAASASPGRPPWSAASRSRSASSRARTTCRSRSPTSSPRCCRRARSSRFLRVWQPGRAAAGRGPLHAGPRSPAPRPPTRVHEREVRRRSDDTQDSRGDVFGAYAPYIIIIVVFSLAQWGPIKDFVAEGSRGRSTGPA